jgi:sodium/hydrogen exchanger 8
LFYLVFGESVLNDAVGLCLFNAFAKFVAPLNDAGKVAFEFTTFLFMFMLDATMSPILGIVFGCASALLFKLVDMRKNRLLELSLYVMIMYVPFLFAEMIHLSGIVTILFTGMTARSFVVPNLSDKTADSAETVFKIAAHLAETSIFLELGLSFFGLKGSFNWRFILWALLACLVGRALNIYPITAFFNKALQRPKPEGDDPASQIELEDALSYSIQRQDSGVTLTPRKERDLKINTKTAHMLWFSGLRGAVAYACVRSFPNTFSHQTEFVMTTMAIILVTVFLLGGTTTFVLNHLGIDMNVNEEEYMEEWHEQRQHDGLIL